MHTMTAPRTLGATLPAVWWRSAALVLGGALLTAVAAQISIPLSFTPVPLTGQTFAVLLVGTALGARLGILSQLLYLALGLVFPFYSGGASGWDVLTGATLGYFVGFVVAAGFVGFLAERGQDRKFATSVTAMLAGSAIIYVFGVTWLAFHLDIPFYSGDGQDAFTFGLAPFIVGDIIKLLLAAGITPLAWRAVDRFRNDDTTDTPT